MHLARTAALVALLSFAPEVQAAERSVVLFICEDEDLGAGEGGCTELLQALAEELRDFGLVVANAESVGEEELNPGALAVRTSQQQALFAVWFSRSAMDGGERLTIHVYAPDSLQTISKILVEVEPGGAPDLQDVAFRLRTLMGASLFSDLDDIVGDDLLLALAFPEEKKEVITKIVAPWPAQPHRPPRTWVRLGQGYTFLAYPLEKHWYHGLSLLVSLVPLDRLEVFVDAALTFGGRETLPVEGETIRIDNRQYLVGLGVGGVAVVAGPFALVPMAGFHLGVSDSFVTFPGEDRRYREINPALWVGLEARFSVARWVALVLGVEVENLFRYEEFTWVGETVFGLSQLRLSVTAGLRVSL